MLPIGINCDVLIIKELSLVSSQLIPNNSEESTYMDLVVCIAIVFTSVA